MDVGQQAETQFNSAIKEQRMKRLHFLLEKSSAYATILGQKLARQQEEARERAAKSQNQPAADTTTRRGRVTRKRKVDDADYKLEEYLNEEVSETVAL